MVYSNRFIKISQILFSAEISEEDINAATKIVEELDKSEEGLQSWIDSIENNLEVFNNYHGKEKALVHIADQFDENQEKQKEKYERVIIQIKHAIDLIGEVQDVEMQDMISNITQSSEEFTDKYNDLMNIPTKIGENGFIQAFKDASQSLIDGIDPFFDVMNRIRDYVMKHMLGKQSLS